MHREREGEGERDICRQEMRREQAERERFFLLLLSVLSGRTIEKEID